MYCPYRGCSGPKNGKKVGPVFGSFSAHDYFITERFIFKFNINVVTILELK